MLFQSKEFLLYFLPTVLIGFYVLQKLFSYQLAKLYLLTCSLFFYGWWKPVYVPVFLAAVFVNFMMAKVIRRRDDSSVRKKLMWLGVSFNVGLLFVFKYVDFVTGTFNDLAGTSIPALHFVLPLGISFFTFQNIAYIVDNYEGLGDETRFTDYLLYLAFFPHLLAGPIMHHKELLDQIKEPKPFSSWAFYLGLYIFLMGMFKKVGIADTFADWANSGFSNHVGLNMFEGWATGLSYLFQLYFDFSGYSDMAIGLGMMFQVTLPINFDSPLKSASIIEFWQRWHMTLTRFINFYIFTPMVRSFAEPTTGAILLCTFLSMFIAGIWHGAGWTFVLFGLFHGLGLVVNHLWRSRKLKMPRPIGWLCTFVFVTCGFVMFRAPTLGVGFDVLKGMFGFNGIVLDPSIFGRLQTMLPAALVNKYVTFDSGWFARIGNLDRKFVLFFAISLSVVLWSKNANQLKSSFKWSWLNALATAALALLTANILYVVSHPSKFLYFNF